MAQFRKFPSIVKKAAKKYFKDGYYADEAKELWTDTLDIYERFVDEAPDLGGKENTMSDNLYLALAVFAFYEATDRTLTREEMEEIMTESVPESIPVFSALMDFNKPRNQAKLQKRFEKYKALSDEKLSNGEWGNNWRVEINPHNRKKGVAFDLTCCPLADFAKAHGYEEILPLLCKFDYMTAGLIRAKLIREHTIAEGAPYCDYWYVGNKETDIS